MRAHWCILILSIAVLHKATSRIYQYSEAGETGQVNFTLALQGGESECNSLFATGDLMLLLTVLNFNGKDVISSEPLDMFVVITNRDTGACLQYGGYNVEYSADCLIMGSWPSEWDSHSSGYYSATANFSEWKYTGSEWTVCVGNGYIQEPYPDPDDVYYEGTLNFTSLTTTSLPPSLLPTSIPTPVPTVSGAPSLQPVVPTTPMPSSSQSPSSKPTPTPSTMPSITLQPTHDPFVVTTDCESGLSQETNAVINITFDSRLSGKEKVCSEFSATGLLNEVIISLYFSGSTTKEYPYDMLLSIGYLGENITNLHAVQIGGFDVFTPDVAYGGTWPDNWKSPVEGWYYSSVNVTRFSVSGNGSYEVCMMNAWQHAKEVSYDGFLYLPDLQLPGCSVKTTAAPTVTPTVTSTPSPTFAPTVVTAISSIPTIITSNVPTSSVPTIRNIEQSSDVGEDVSVRFTVDVAPFECVCLSVPGDGQLLNISSSIAFVSNNPDIAPSDMLVVISNGLQCIEVGGSDAENRNDGDNICGCTNPQGIYFWSDDFDDGYLHNATVDVSYASLTASGGEWQICISNGFIENSSPQTNVASKKLLTLQEDSTEAQFSGIVSLEGVETASPLTTDNDADDNDENSYALSALFFTLVVVAVITIVTIIVLSSRHIWRRALTSMVGGSEEKDSTSNHESKGADEESVMSTEAKSVVMSPIVGVTIDESRKERHQQSKDLS